MIQVKDGGLLEKTYPQGFSNAPLKEYAKHSKILMNFFDDTKNYAALI